ncbi:aminotransferase class IV [Candidatus Clavichlamydia salmonicola]|uniref:aminotransferase class IV n=1 Tax=Candidatus Clavichlamydia salmonicola TaxID=469812 RepID=UPI001891B961|nr:aminotransferase class IV [Candidatus Clavichlamydia salmonicola]
MKFCFFNEVPIKENDVQIPINDAGFLYGDGIYTSILIRNGIPVFFERQMALLQALCKQQQIVAPIFSKTMILELLNLNNISTNSPDHYLRIIVTGGAETPSRIFQLRKGFSLVTVKELTLSFSDILKVIFFPFPSQSQHTHYKSLAHLNRYYIRDFAKKSGYDDAISISCNNEILELSFGNLFWIDQQDVFIPSPALPLYHGITIQVMTEILIKLNYKIHFVKWNKETSLSNYLCFATSTFMGIRPIQSIGDAPLPIDSKITSLLQTAFAEAILTHYKNFNNH